MITGLKDQVQIVQFVLPQPVVTGELGRDVAGEGLSSAVGGRCWAGSVGEGFRALVGTEAHDFAVSLLVALQTWNETKTVNI